MYSTIYRLDDMVTLLDCVVYLSLLPALPVLSSHGHPDNCLRAFIVTTTRVPVRGTRTTAVRACPSKRMSSSWNCLTALGVNHFLLRKGIIFSLKIGDGDPKHE